jgi:hypothetical protein
MTPPDGAVDLGDGHWVTWFVWSPDRDLNPQHVGLDDLDPAGVIVWHQARTLADDAECKGAVTFTPPGTHRHLFAGRPTWEVESLDPLTISPSVLCRRCGDHGFIRGGRWVRA